MFRNWNLNIQTRTRAYLFFFARIDPRNLNAKTNKSGKSVVDEEEVEDIDEGEKILIEDEDDLSDVDLGEEEDKI